MSKQSIEQLVQSALDSLHQSGKLVVPYSVIQIDATKDKQHGDFSCNIAMVLAKAARMKPRDLADMIVAALPASSLLTKVEIAGPGFINFFLSSHAFYQVIQDILIQGEHYGRADVGKGKRILLEFVSSNPTGPLHVGHGRHAAYGAIVANLLNYIGYQVHCEYYVNDAGRQMDILAVSIWLRYLSLFEEKINFPVNAYQGDYVIDIAKKLKEKYQQSLYQSVTDVFHAVGVDEPQGGDKERYIDAVIERAKALLGQVGYQQLVEFGLACIIEDIRQDLAEFGVHYSTWFSEREFIQTGAVERLIENLQAQNLVYEKEGALWFKATAFGDEKDRVLQRSNGQRTYFANDVGYHINKFERGFDAAINIFGSDHHGYIPRMKAALQASGIPDDKLTYLLVQFVTLYRGGQQASMSTRSGSFVTLRELRAEVGNDAARFFYVMRKCEQPMDFDLDLAKSQSNENPVYYIQYAHARICSVFRQMQERGLKYDQNQAVLYLEQLTADQEKHLLTTLSRYPETVKAAAEGYAPHLLTHYLRELANDFHVYYNSHQFLIDEDTVRQARLALIAATRQVLINGLTLLGVSTPDRM